ncbi:N-acyl amino acid synthase FeeM domain-containing protein [Methylobacterium sp. SI9]|uniref:N-acyl amino acid synthase FeeM domain-containing protein n=1 Tax=Methylobacterium guangdongense TaxID=3138811 RepID=UPI00313E3222
MPTIEAIRPQGLNARAISLLERITYRRAIDTEDREAIFRLRHEAYLREGAITARADQRFTDAVDEQKNAFIYGVYVDGTLSGSIRLNITLPYASALPTTAVFPDIVGPMIDAGCIIVDPTRFVANPNLSRRLPELPYLTLRLAWLAMEHFEGEYILLAIRPEHRAFYRRYWSATEMCEARPYPKLTKPVGLSVVNYLEVKKTVESRYPFLASTDAERASLFAPHTVPVEADDTHTEIWQIAPARVERNASV